MSDVSEALAAMGQARVPLSITTSGWSMPAERIWWTLSGEGGSLGPRPSSTWREGRLPPTREDTPQGDYHPSWSETGISSNEIVRRRTINSQPNFLPIGFFGPRIKLKDPDGWHGHFISFFGFNWIRKCGVTHKENFVLLCYCCIWILLKDSPTDPGSCILYPQENVNIMWEKDCNMNIIHHSYSYAPCVSCY